jgi:hypothetical protein
MLLLVHWNQLPTVRPHWYFRTVCWERGIMIHCIWSQVSAVIKQRHALSQTLK